MSVLMDEEMNVLMDEKTNVLMDEEIDKKYYRFTQNIFDRKNSTREPDKYFENFGNIDYTVGFNEQYSFVITQHWFPEASLVPATSSQASGEYDTFLIAEIIGEVRIIINESEDENIGLIFEDFVQKYVNQMSISFNELSANQKCVNIINLSPLIYWTILLFSTQYNHNILKAILIATNCHASPEFDDYAFQKPTKHHKSLNLMNKICSDINLLTAFISVSGKERLWNILKLKKPWNNAIDILMRNYDLIFAIFPSDTEENLTQVIKDFRMEKTGMNILHYFIVKIFSDNDESKYDDSAVMTKLQPYLDLKYVKNLKGQTPLNFLKLRADFNSKNDSILHYTELTNIIEKGGISYSDICYGDRNSLLCNENFFLMIASNDTQFRYVIENHPENFMFAIENAVKHLIDNDLQTVCKKILDYLLQLDVDQLTKFATTKIGDTPVYFHLAALNIINYLIEGCDGKFKNLMTNILQDNPYLIPYLSRHNYTEFFKNTINLQNVLFSIDKPHYFCEYLNFIFDDIVIFVPDTHAISDLVEKLVDFSLIDRSVFDRSSNILPLVMLCSMKEEYKNIVYSNIINDNKSILETILKVILTQINKIENEELSFDSFKIIYDMYSLHPEIVANTIKSPEFNGFIVSNMKKFKINGLINAMIEHKMEGITHKFIFGNMDTDSFYDSITKFSGTLGGNILAKLNKFGYIDNLFEENNDLFKEVIKYDNITILNFCGMIPNFDTKIFFASNHPDELSLFDTKITTNNYQYVCELVLYSKVLSEQEKYDIVIKYYNDKKIFDDVLCLLSPFITKNILGDRYNEIIIYLLSVRQMSIFMIRDGELSEESLNDFFNFPELNNSLNDITDFEPYVSNTAEIYLKNIPLYITIFEDDSEYDISIKSKKFVEHVEFYSSFIIGCLNYSSKHEKIKCIIRHSTLSIDSVIKASKLNEIFMIDIFYSYDFVDLITKYPEFIKDIIRVYPEKVNEKITGVINLENVDEIIMMFSHHLPEINFVKYLLEYSANEKNNLLNCLVESKISNKNDLSIEVDKIIDSGFNINMKFFEKYIQNDITDKQFNYIIETYPELSLNMTNIITNINDLIKNMKFTQIKRIIMSKYIDQYPDIQNYICEISDDDKLVEILKRIHIKSSFIVDNKSKICELIKKCKQIYYNFIVNDIYIDEYLYTTDDNDDYLIFYAADIIKSEHLEKFFSEMLRDTSKLGQLLELNKRGHSKFSRSHNLPMSAMNEILTMKISDDLLNSFSSQTIPKILFNFLLKKLLQYVHCDTLVKFIKDRGYLNFVDEHNKNILMMISGIVTNCNMSLIIKSLDDTEKKTILSHKDDSGENLLFYLFNDIDILNIYVETFGKEALCVSNNNNETVLMKAIKTIGAECLPLLNYENFDSRQNYAYENSGSVISYAISYLEPDFIIENILKWKHLSKNYTELTQYIKLYDWSSIEVVDVNLNNLFLIGIKAPEVFRYILNNDDEIVDKLNTYKMTIRNNKYSVIEAIYLYEPLSFQYLLGSDHISKINYDQEFFNKNLTYQPASWYIYANSLHYIVPNDTDRTIYDDDDDEDYTSGNIYDLKYLNKMRHFIQTKNETTVLEADKCRVCLTGKNKIMFGCYKHLSCVSCAVRLPSCPYCRNDSGKVKVFD